MKVYVLISVDLFASFYDDEPHIYIKVGRSTNLSERINSIKRKSQSVTTLSPVECSDYPLGYDIYHLHPQKLHEPYLSLKSIDKYCDYNYDLLPNNDPFSRKFSIVVFMFYCP